MVPAFAYSLYLTLYKTDISLRRTFSAGPKGVRLGESTLYSNGGLRMLSRNPGIMRAVHVYRQVEAKKLGKHIGELKKRSFSATGVNRKWSFSFVDGRPNFSVKVL